MNTVKQMNGRVVEAALAVPGLLRDVQPAERFNVASHLAGAVVHPILALLLARHVLEEAGLTAAVGCMVFGLGLTGAYLASVAYHAARGEERVRLRRWDRCGIFVGVASYHTATILIGMPGKPGVLLVAAIWILAGRAARRELAPAAGSGRATIAPYLALGWGGMLSWGSAATALAPAGFTWLVLSAVVASTGALAYHRASIPHHHELWHVLVMLGNACVLLSWGHGF